MYVMSTHNMKAVPNNILLLSIFPQNRKYKKIKLRFGHFSSNMDYGLNLTFNNRKRFKMVPMIIFHQLIRTRKYVHLNQFLFSVFPDFNIKTTVDTLFAVIKDTGSWTHLLVTRALKIFKDCWGQFCLHFTVDQSFRNIWLFNLYEMRTSL